MYISPDVSEDFAFVRNHDDRFFDFQIAAIEKATNVLLSNKSFCLACDAGLGKSLCAAKIISNFIEQRPQSQILLVAPGSLVHQLTKTLTNYPWGEETGLKPKLIQKGVELAAAIEDLQCKDVLICNKALKWVEHLDKFTLIVHDEMHVLSYDRSRQLRDRLLLCLTATPEHAFHMYSALNFQCCHDPNPHEVAKADVRARMINIRKTTRVMQLVGTAKTVLQKWDTEHPNLTHYYAQLFHWADTFAQPIPRIVYLSTIVKLALENGVSPLPDLSPERLEAHVKDAIRQSGNIMIRNSLRFHRMMAAQALAARRIYSRVTQLSSTYDFNVPILADATLQEAFVASQALEHSVCGINELASCGLLMSELQTLHAIHCAYAPEPQLVCSQRSQEKFGETQRFTAAIVRLPTQREAKRKFNALKNDTRIQPFLLSSSLTAAGRTNAIRKFSSFGGLRSKWTCFRRQIHNSTNPLCHEIFSGCFGDIFISSLSSYLVKKRILVCDNTIDVGLDMHRVTDAIIIPRLIATQTEFHQLLGRCSRIATERSSQGSVELTTSKIIGTLDELFDRNIQLGEDVPHPKTRSFYETFEIMAGEIAKRLVGDPVLSDYFDENVRKRARYFTR